MLASFATSFEASVQTPLLISDVTTAIRMSASPRLADSHSPVVTIALNGDVIDATETGVPSTAVPVKVESNVTSVLQSGLNMNL